MNKEILTYELGIANFKEEEVRTAAQALLLACSTYLLDFGTNDGHNNQAGIGTMLASLDFSERHAYGRSGLDELFDTLPPTSYAYRCYDAFKKFSFGVQEKAAGMLYAGLLINELEEEKLKNIKEIVNNKSKIQVDNIWNQKDINGNCNYNKGAILGENNCGLDNVATNEKENNEMFEKKLSESIAKAKNQNDKICIIEQSELPPKDLPKFANQVSMEANKPALIVIDNIPTKDNESVCAIAIDKNNIGMKQILKTPYTKRIESAGDFFIIDLNKNKIQEFVNEVLNNAKKLENHHKKEQNKIRKTNTRYEQEVEKIAKRANQQNGNIVIIRDDKIDKKDLSDFVRDVAKKADKSIMIVQKTLYDKHTDAKEKPFGNMGCGKMNDESDVLLCCGFGKHGIKIYKTVPENYFYDGIIYDNNIFICYINGKDFEEFKLRTEMNDFVLNTLLKNMNENTSYSEKEKEECIKKLDNKIKEEIKNTTGLASDVCDVICNDIITLGIMSPTRKIFIKELQILYPEIILKDFNTPEFEELKAASDKYTKNRIALGV